MAAKSHNLLLERTGASDGLLMSKFLDPKKPPTTCGRLEFGEIEPDVDYGAYVIVRVPATLWIVTVTPCVKVVGYVSLATVFRALT
jgi:hypothetical protein